MGLPPVFFLVLPLGAVFIATIVMLNAIRLSQRQKRIASLEQDLTDLTQQWDTIERRLDYVEQMIQASPKSGEVKR